MRGPLLCRLPVVRVRMSCGACRHRALFVGMSAAKCAEAWADAHRIPEVDEVELRGVDGSREVYRRRRPFAPGRV